MPQERTEQQILSKEPLKVTLGSTQWELPILALTPMRKWRELVIEAAKEIGTLGVSLTGLGAAFVAFPEKIVELVFAYAPKLPREELLAPEAGATEEQFALAFSEIASVAFPCRGQLSLLKALAMIPNPSPSEKSTNSSSPSTGSLPIM